MFFRAGYFTEARVNGKVWRGQRHEVDDAQRRRPVRDCATIATSKRACSCDDQKSHTSTSSRSPIPRRPATSCAWRPTSMCRPAAWAAWRSGRRRWAAPTPFSAGFDLRWVDGDSEEDGYRRTGPDVNRRCHAGGDAVGPTGVRRHAAEHSGAFVQDIFTPNQQAGAHAAARVSIAGATTTATISRPPSPRGSRRPTTEPALPDESDNVASPRAAALYHVSDRDQRVGRREFGLPGADADRTVSAVRGRCGDDASRTTLGPERLVGGEAGLNLAPMRNLTVRTTWFHNRVSDPVANVTQIASFCSARAYPPAARRSRTSARRACGASRPMPSIALGTFWRVSGAYMRDDAKVTDGGTVPALVGKFLPQVPKHRGSVQVSTATRKSPRSRLASRPQGCNSTTT